MTNPPPHADSTRNASDIIEEIWRRARINAFAHKFAHESAERKAFWMRIAQTSCSLLSILAIIGVYLLSSNDGNISFLFQSSADPNVAGQAAQTSGASHARALLALIFTAASIVFTFMALFLDIIALHLGHAVVAAEHRSLLGSYQYIAQRAREAKWPDRPYEELVELLRDLERDFQLLKARGTEPGDTVFRMANELFDQIRRDPVSSLAQSFPQADAADADQPEAPGASGE